jgi:outer membrane receptor protein involved in Fe transport
VATTTLVQALVLSRPTPSRQWIHALQVTLLICLINALASQVHAAQEPTALQTAIPASSLSVAMRDFARQTAIQVMYLSVLTDGRESGGASAGLSARAALDALLAGSGLRFEFLNARSVRLYAAARDTSRDGDTESKHLRRAVAVMVTSPTLEEVIISATKRDEPLQAVAMSALVLPQEELDAAGIRGLGDIAARTPGMQYDLGSQFGPGIMSNLVIRGISADRGTAPTVGIYIDDVPIQSVRIALYKTQPITFDLARVEVLRGPQGTLFGSSAVGGAIRYITNEASTTDSSQLYRGQLSSTAQGGASAEAGAIVDGPLQQGRLGARASVWYRRDGGYIDRINPLTGAIVDQDANRSVSKVLRLGLVFEPDETLRLVPSFHYQSAQLNDTPMFYTGAPGSPPQSAPYRTSLLQNGKLLRQPYKDIYYIGSAKLEKNFAAIKLTAVTAWFDRKASTTVDETNDACVFVFGDCGNPLGPAYPSSYNQAIPFYIQMHQNAFTGELRLSSSDTTARFNWLAGLFYSNTHLHRTEDVYQVIVPEEPAVHSETFVASGALDGFAKASFALTPRWSVGMGSRFGWTRGSFAGYQTGYANDRVPSSQSAGPYDAVPTSPRFEFTYRPNERNFYYATAARGSRPGGSAIPGDCNGIPLPDQLEPDVLWSYELGSKNVLLNHRLRFDTSAYYAHWDGLHGHVYDACNNSYITNTGLAVSQGFDLAAEWEQQRLNVGMSLGYGDIRYRRTVFNTTGQIVAQRGAVVAGLPEVPAPWNGSLTASYRWPLHSGFEARVRAEELFTSRNHGPFMEHNPVAAYFVADSAQADPSTAQLNLQLVVSRPHLEVGIAINNALNARPTLHATSDGDNSTQYYAYTFRPRCLQLTVTRRN